MPWLEISLFILYSWLNSNAGIFALRSYLWLPVQLYAEGSISTAAYNHVMTLSSDFHDSKQSGELYQTMGLGQSVSDLLNKLLFQILPMLLDLFVAIVYLYYLFDGYMALIVAGVVVVYLCSSTYFNAWQVGVRRRLISKWKAERQLMYDTMGSWQTVSYFNRLKHERERYSAAVDAHLLSEWNYSAVGYLTRATQSSVLLVGLLGACFLSAYQVVHGTKSLGSFVILLTYWGQLSGPLSVFGSLFRQISSDFLDAEELLELLQLRPSIKDRGGAKDLVLREGAVDFDNVHFAYDSARQTLKGITFRALPGQTIALVGETGGGKSTLLKLLFRFYDVSKGSIKIDGQDIRDVTLASLRENIGVVPQDPSLFNESIMSNVRYAKLQATDEEVYEACKAAAVHDKIMTFTKGYQSRVGERGVKLSGGELQRIAIARAILKDPKIILLDEATSSVDTETETLIQEALRKLTAGRTTFVVAHRLSTITRADLIIVIKNGSILEQGNHDELLQLKGKYYGLWSKQAFYEPGPSRSQNPRDQEGPNVKDLTSGSKNLGIVEHVNHSPRKPKNGSAEVPKSREQKQGMAHEQEDGALGKENRGTNKDNLDMKETPSASKDKLWRPDAPEFIPHFFRTSFGPNIAPTFGMGGKQSQSSGDVSKQSGQGQHSEGQPKPKSKLRVASSRKGSPPNSQINKANPDTALSEVPPSGTNKGENGKVYNGSSKDKHRRGGKGKTKDPSTPSANTSEESSDKKKTSQPEGATSSESSKADGSKTEFKRPRRNRRGQSKSEPTGQGRSQADTTTDIEPASTNSSDGQAMTNHLRRVSAPSGPSAGQNAKGKSNYVQRRRRRHWRKQNRDTSGTQSTQSTASGSMDAPPTGSPSAPVTSPAAGASAGSATVDGSSGNSVRFAPGS